MAEIAPGIAQPNGPELWESIVFTAELDIGRTDGASATVDIKINDRPFVLQTIRHEIIRDGSGNNPVQDGRYRIQWSKADERQYFKGPVPMVDSNLGSVRHGRFYDLPQPIGFIASQTANVTIINALTREDHFTVQVQFVGVEKVR
jgi:hypothetical protein